MDCSAAGLKKKGQASGWLFLGPFLLPGTTLEEKDARLKQEQHISCQYSHGQRTMAAYLIKQLGLALSRGKPAAAVICEKLSWGE